MDFERSSEILPPQETREHRDESGYSEKEQAQITEGSMMDRKRVNSGQMANKRKRVVPVTSRKEKITSVYKANSGKIISLVQSLYDLDGVNPRQEEQIVEEIKRLRKIQEELLNALLLEQKGSLTEESISKEAWNLIQ